MRNNNFPSILWFWLRVPVIKWQINMRKTNRSLITFIPPLWASQWFSEESACQSSRCWLDPWVRKMLWSRKWQPAPLFLPRKFHGPKSLWTAVHGFPRVEHNSHWSHTRIPPGKTEQLPEVAQVTTLNTVFRQKWNKDVWAGRGWLWQITRKSKNGKPYDYYADLCAIDKSF